LEGLIVETASDGQEGIRKIVSFLPEIVLLDLYMPRVSGFDVLKSVKENVELKNIPIIVLTNINPDSQDLMKNWGVTDFLLKSDNTLKQIVEKVRMILSR
jgi:CheY-like chemotaxis protein